MLYCFELTKELVVQDHWSVGEPISSLTWSASYDKLAVCTPQVNTLYVYLLQEAVSCYNANLYAYVLYLQMYSIYILRVLRHYIVYKAVFVVLYCTVLSVLCKRVHFVACVHLIA